MKSCFLIGHRDTPESVLPMLCAAIERHIEEYGVAEFVIGHYGNFDRFALKALRQAKQKHPDISLLLLLPYHPARHPVALPAGMDGSWHPAQTAGRPQRTAILSANRAAVDRANYLIAYVCHPSNGARSILEYAVSREKRGLIKVENLAEGALPPQT